MTADAVPFYEAHAEALAARYDSLPAEGLFADLLDLLPAAPARGLDAGAGTGRDAAFLRARGLDLTLAEPAAPFRARLRGRFPGVPLHDARLPDLGGVAGPFDLVVVNAVWQHLDAPARDAALDRLAGLLAPGGRLLLSLRQGPPPPDRPVHPLDAGEEAARAAARGFAVLRVRPIANRSLADAAAGVAWTWLALERKAAP